jgi:hypothetical protein
MGGVATRRKNPAPRRQSASRGVERAGPRRLVRAGTALVLLAAAWALLLPALIPGLRLAQVGLSAALAAAATWLLAGVALAAVRRRWVRATATGLFGLVVACGWAAAELWFDADFGIVGSRELRYTVHGRGATFYVYQWSAIPDGWDGAEVMQRRGLVRVRGLQVNDVALAAELFDGRTLRVGQHRLRLSSWHDGERAWVDGRRAEVVARR